VVSKPPYARETLYIVHTPTDSIVAKFHSSLTRPLSLHLTCNDATNRVYVIDSMRAGSPYIWLIDGSGDSVIRRCRMPGGAYRGIVCDTARNVLYLGRYYRSGTRGRIDIVDGATMQVDTILDAGWWINAPILDTARGRVVCATGKKGFTRSSTLLVLGCASREYEGITPLWHQPYGLCRNPNEQKLYYLWGDGPGGIGVVDERSGRVITQITSLGGATLAFSQTSNKLYYRTGESLWVIDGSADTMVKSLDLGSGACCDDLWNRGLNRLYTTCHGDEFCELAAIDCNTDSVIRTIRLRGCVRELILAERQKMLFGFFGHGGFQGLMCDPESIVVDSLTDWNIQAHAYSPAEGKLYIGLVGQLNVYHVWPFYLVKSIDWPYTGGAYQHLACSDTTHKLYWCADDTLMVLDMRGDTLVRLLSGNFRMMFSCLDRSGASIWFLSTNDSVFIYDTRSDTLSAVLPTFWTHAPLHSPELGRIYIGQYHRSPSIFAYPDTPPAGVAGAPTLLPRPSQPTVQRAAHLILTGNAPWYDITGRQVAVRGRANDRLSIEPGVYLCPRPGRVASKVVVVR